MVGNGEVVVMTIMGQGKGKLEWIIRACLQWNYGGIMVEFMVETIVEVMVEIMVEVMVILWWKL